MGPQDRGGRQRPAAYRKDHHSRGRVQHYVAPHVPYPPRGLSLSLYLSLSPPPPPSLFLPCSLSISLSLTHTRMHARARAHTHTHNGCIYVSVCVCVCLHTHTHTHTQVTYSKIPVVHVWDLTRHTSPLTSLCAHTKPVGDLVWQVVCVYERERERGRERVCVCVSESESSMHTVSIQDIYHEI